jgi:predicted nucleic acid-binding protein
MIAGIDTNVLLDVLVPNEQFYDAAAGALQDSATAGSLVICDIVYAELCVHFENQLDCDAFLASRAWRTYRRQGGKRTRILAGFLIGAHAYNQATRLLSRDRGFYHTLFPSLRLYDPTETSPRN